MICGHRNSFTIFAGKPIDFTRVVLSECFANDVTYHLSCLPIPRKSGLLTIINESFVIVFDLIIDVIDRDSSPRKYTENTAA